MNNTVSISLHEYKLSLILSEAVHYTYTQRGIAYKNDSSFRSTQTVQHVCEVVLPGVIIPTYTLEEMCHARQGSVCSHYTWHANSMRTDTHHI